MPHHLKVVTIPNLKTVIHESRWDKKYLAENHLEMSGLCGFGCLYCSSNSAGANRYQKDDLLEMVIAQTGEHLTAKDNPELTYVYRSSVVDQLRVELAAMGPRKRKTYGLGLTIAPNQMTDPLHPAVNPDDFEDLLKVLHDQTHFRIRILTKNAQIGSARWIKVLQPMGDRVTVSLSTGTLDAGWARQVEIGTSNPAARLRALRNLQDAGIPTYAMLCPVFPDAIPRLDELIDAVRPSRCEYIWSEPFNDRDNWEKVRDGYQPGTREYEWFDRVFGPNAEKELWSAYAADLYKHLRIRSVEQGWAAKLQYMLYEAKVKRGFVRSFCDRSGKIHGGVLLQSVDKTGLSRNPEFRAAQEKARVTAWDRVGYEDHDVDPQPALLDELHSCVYPSVVCSVGAA